MRSTWSNIFAGMLMVMLISVLMAGSANAQSKGPATSWASISTDDINVLNGLDFRGKMGALGEKDGKDEEIRFRDGTIQSLLCENCNFLPAKYTIEKGAADYTLEFRAESTNEKGDRMLWNGTIELDHTGLIKRHKIEAYATYIPVGKESRLFWMNGEASEQSMKYAGKSAPKDNMQTASRDNN